jgi:hypothetical protein
MKLLPKILIIFLVLTKSYSQKNELKICLNSGLYSFRGDASAAKTNMYFVNYPPIVFISTVNPYGIKNGLSSGLSLNFQRVLKENIIFGINAGYQSNKSKILIDIVDIDESSNIQIKEVDGQSYVTNNSLLAYPFFGYRFENNIIPIDLLAGINFDYILSTKENGSAIDSNNVEYNTSSDIQTINLDVSPKLQIATEYKKFGVILGYSFGLVNYYRDDYVDSMNYNEIKKAHSNLINFGVTYKLK